MKAVIQGFNFRWSTGIRIGATVMLTLAGLTVHSAPVNRYVDINATNPVSPYTSWDTAGTDIVEVVSVANANDSGDIVYVAAGIYYLTNQIIVGNTVVTNWAGDRALTIIDGNYSSHTNRCFYLTDKKAVVSGFTIRNGHTQTNDLLGMGGGVYMIGGKVHDCIIMSNVASYEINNYRGGGGVYMTAGELLDSDVKGNTANGIHELNRGALHGGGGVYAGGGLISNCWIHANTGTTACAGGVFLRGSIRDSIVSSNYVAPGNYSYGGGGIATFRAGLIENVRIVGNTSTQNGGGIYISDATTTALKMRNCLLADNTADRNGGGVYANYSLGDNQESIANCTIVSNEAVLGGGIFFKANSTTSVVNTIIYYNRSTGDTEQNVYDNNINTFAIIQSCVELGTANFVIPNAVSSPPQFVNSGAGDWRLRTSSPCVDAGVNRIWMRTSLDLDGGPRIRYGIVDMGAHEAQRRETVLIFRYQSPTQPPPLPRMGFVFTNGILTIRTDRYLVTWENGCLTQVATLHNGIQRLSVGTNAMQTGWLPNGMGSFHEQQQAGNAQHRALWSQSLNKGLPSFPAQHPADENSQVICQAIKDGVRLTYAGLQGDATAKLIQELTVEPETGDLVIRQKASSDNPGLFGIGFSLMNLNPEITFALPYFSGVRVGGRDDPRRGGSGWAWPGFWSAGLIVGEVPGGGSFFVFADDPKLGPKYLKMYSADDVQGLGFEACAQYPYADRRNVEICDWRFNTFAGSWMEPAERYKQWLATAYGCKPRRERSPAWFNDIALYVPAIMDTNSLQLLGQKIDPRHILMNRYSWAKGFNRNAPFYQPLDAQLDQTAAQLHAFGSHYGVYVSHKLIDRHAYPELMAQYNCHPAVDALSGDAAILDAILDPESEIVEEDENNENYLISIHPGSDTWIEFYSNLMVAFHETYAMDVFYQDIAGSNYGSSGLIDGRSIHEGMVACEKRIREKLPQTATIGEHWNEVIVAAGMELGSGSYHSWFSPQHHQWLGDSAHPLLGYIFGDHAGLVMYKTPILNTEQFHRDQNFLEVIGSMPTWRGDASSDNAEARLVILRARLFADGFAPYYPKVWEQDAVAYMRNAQGQVVKYLRRDGSTFCYKEVAGKDALYYARVTGRHALPMPEPVHIDGWYAYDAQGPIGLTPEKWYVVFPGEPERSALTIVGLPENVCVAGIRLHTDYFLADLGGTGAGTVAVVSTVPLLGQTVPGTSYHVVTAPESLLLAFRDAPGTELGEILPLQNWSLLEVVNGLVTGQANWWREPGTFRKFGEVTCLSFGVTPPVGGQGSEISVDGYIHLPDDKRVALAFSMGRFGGAGDGVNFVVRVNGKEIWRQFSPANKRSWTPAVVPLADFVGQNIVLSLAVDCGSSGFNTSNDHSFWGDPKVILHE